MLSIYTPLRWLKEKGFRSYLVGNQVRAILQEKEESTREIDVATDALAEEVLAILSERQIIPTFFDGKFGTVSCTWQGIDFSFTTLREDLYSRKELARFKRYPARIRFVRSLQKDAQRRDLTINAIYYDPGRARFFDPVGGLKDWRRRVVRLIGEPGRRLEEDPLRILRAIRFKNLLNFHYHPATWRALVEKGFLVRSLSAGVKAKELNKLKEIPHFQSALRELREIGGVGV